MDLKYSGNVSISSSDPFHLELHSVKPEQKKQGPKAKNTVQDDMPKPQTPQLDLFAEF